MDVNFAKNSNGADDILYNTERVHVFISYMKITDMSCVEQPFTLHLSLMQV